MKAFIRFIADMRPTLGKIGLLFLVFLLPVYGVPPTFVVPKKNTPPKVITRDSVLAPTPKSAGDSLPSKVTVQSPAAVDPVRDSVLNPKDSLTVVKTRADTVILIRHRFNHKEQIIAGGVVMACLAAMMAVMNNYNPR